MGNDIINKYITDTLSKYLGDIYSQNFILQLTNEAIKKLYDIYYDIYSNESNKLKFKQEVTKAKLICEEPVPKSCFKMEIIDKLDKIIDLIDINILESYIETIFVKNLKLQLKHSNPSMQMNIYILDNFCNKK
jgi:hypothetical protein